ncbi:MAG: hypothetical protein QNK40_14500 [Desulfobacterales bacterium]|nr:hypothetical protein [Desulfobacterales bacterium]
MGIRTFMRKSLTTNLFFSDSEFPKREGQESVRTDSLLYDIARQWENLVVNHDSLFGHLCLAEIMNLYQSSFWGEVTPVGETGTAHVIACMPRLEHSVPEPRRESGWEAAQIFRTVLMPPDVVSYGVGQSCGITSATIVANIY